MRGIGGEPALVLERSVQAVEQAVDRGNERLRFTRGGAAGEWREVFRRTAEDLGGQVVEGLQAAANGEVDGQQQQGKDHAERLHRFRGDLQRFLVAFGDRLRNLDADGAVVGFEDQAAPGLALVFDRGETQCAADCDSWCVGRAHEHTAVGPADLEFEGQVAVVVIQATHAGKVRGKLREMLMPLLRLDEHQRRRPRHLAVHQFLDFVLGPAIAERGGQAENNHRRDRDERKQPPAQGRRAPCAAEEIRVHHLPSLLPS